MAKFLTLLLLGILARGDSPPTASPQKAPAFEIAEIIFPRVAIAPMKCPSTVTEHYQDVGIQSVACGMTETSSNDFRKGVNEALPAALDRKRPVQSTTRWVVSGTSSIKALTVGDESVGILFQDGAVILYSLSSGGEWWPRDPRALFEATWKASEEQGLLRAGSEGVSNPELQARANIAHPPLATDNDIDGRVNLRARVEADGTVSSVQVTGSSVPGFGFEEAAVRAVRSSRYKPAMHDGKPVPVLVDVAIEFTAK